MNYQSPLPLDLDKDLVEFWQSVCPTKDTTRQSKGKQNPAGQIWRYPVKEKTDYRKEKALVIQGYAKEIRKMADVMEADDGELNDEVEHVKWAADQIEKMAKRIGQIRWENKQKAQLLKMEEELKKGQEELEGKVADLRKQKEELELLKVEIEREKAEVNLRHDQQKRVGEEQNKTHGEQARKEGVQKRIHMEQDLKEIYLIRRERELEKKEGEERMEEDADLRKQEEELKKTQGEQR